MLNYHFSCFLPGDAGAFDRLRTLLASESDWPARTQTIWREFFFDFATTRLGKTAQWFETREQLILLVAEMLSEGTILLAREGGNLDAPHRLPIDTLVIHHTSRPAEVPDELLEALWLIRLYLPGAIKARSLPWSGHVDARGAQTFAPYHILILPDGTSRRLLPDQAIGYQAGNWQINRSSVGIAFADELEEKEPTRAALDAARAIIRCSYEEAYQRPMRILGHGEINSQTLCPGTLFLKAADGQPGWSNRLRRS